MTVATPVEAAVPGGVPGRLWQGQTPEAREADRRQRLVEAGLELVGTQGVAALTMRAACREAAVGPRYFYEVFLTREELLEAVYDEAIGRLRTPVLEAATAAMTADGVVAALRAAFDTALAVVEQDPRTGRVVFRESAADDTLRARSKAATPEFVLNVLDQTVPERVEALRSAANGWTLMGFSAAIFALFLAWSEGARLSTREEFVEHCAALADDYLGLGLGLAEMRPSGGAK